jgi:predicted dehydrogenase
MSESNFRIMDSRHSRRSFLERLGVTAVAAGLASGHASDIFAQGQRGNGAEPIKLPALTAPTDPPSGDPPAPWPPEKRLGFAVVGLGHLAIEQVLPAFGESRKGKLVGLVSGSSEKASKLAAQYGVSEKNVFDYRHYDRLADNPEIQVVYIALPNSMHAEYTIRAARHGKHVLCEKPMATTIKDGEQMIEECAKASRQLMIAYRIQYEPHNRAAREFVRNKHFGDVKYIDAFNGQRQGDPAQWRMDKKLSGGGSLVDLGIYCLNTIRFLLGEEPVEVKASWQSPANDPRFRSVEDLVTFQLRFPSGVLAHCASSYDSYNSKRYRIATTEGWLGLEPAFPYRGIEMQTAKLEAGKGRVDHPQIESKNQFAVEIDHMADCVRENRKPFTPGEEGLQDQRIMSAIYESAQANSVVKLPKVDRVDAFRGPEPNAS